MKAIRKYGWWAATIIMYIILIVAYVSPLSGWIWLLGGAAFVGFWVKAETVADKFAAKELAAKKKTQRAQDGIHLGEMAASIHTRPWSDYLGKDEEKEIEEELEVA